MPPFGGYAGTNHRGVKLSNRAAVFRAIHAIGPIARVDLARQTGLNPGTVTNIVDDLISGGLVRETGFRSSPRAGRRPVFLAIQPTARYAIGVDLARNAITGALVDLSGQSVRRIVEPADMPWRDEFALSRAHRVIERLLDPLTRTERDRVVGIGIGAPSPVSIRTGQYLDSQSYAAWQAFELPHELERRLGFPTYVDNNANTSALAELWFGAGQGVDNFVLLNLGPGVGSGLVLDGDLYRGNHDLAGEVGHISVNLDGPRCVCGNAGCLETYASVPRVLASVRSALADGAYSTIRADGDGDGDGPTIEQVISALHEADPLAERVFGAVARHLAAGVVNLVYMLDPQLILIGRELSTAGDALLEPVRAEVRQRIFPALRDTIRIELAGVADAPVVGAATLALRELFEAPLGRPAALPT